jgi:hypothetical protein
MSMLDQQQAAITEYKTNKELFDQVKVEIQEAEKRVIAAHKALRSGAQPATAATTTTTTAASSSPINSDNETTHVPDDEDDDDDDDDDEDDDDDDSESGAVKTHAAKKRRVAAAASDGASDGDEPEGDGDMAICSYSLSGACVDAAAASDSRTLVNCSTRGCERWVHPKCFTTQWPDVRSAFGGSKVWCDKHAHDKNKTL